MKLLLFILLCTVSSFNEPFLRQSYDAKDSSRTLRSVLEKIRSTGGLNFIYGDKTAENIRVDASIAKDISKSNIKILLKRYGLGIKFFGSNNAVIYRKKFKTDKNFGSVTVKNIVETGSPEIIEPRMISDVSPVYPDRAIKENVQGTVKIKLYVTESGEVFKTIIQKSSGFGILDSATIDYAGKLKFIPAKVNGINHNIWLSMIFKYQIQNKNLLDDY